MSIRKELTSVWKNLQELDIRPMREAAEQYIQVALVGVPGVGKRTLAAQFQTDPARPHVRSAAPLTIARPDEPEKFTGADLLILLVDVNAPVAAAEQQLLDEWRIAKKPHLVLYNKLDLLPTQDAVIPWIQAREAPVLYGSALDRAFLENDFARTILSMLPSNEMALGRSFPLLRKVAANNLINETCNANATYSLTTGLAEIIPVLNIPLNMADMFILTKAQALLVYKLGLTLGLSTDWQYYVAEFSSVVGSGFLWRHLARSLIGLVPVWGIIPKVAVAYSGTYLVGHVVLGWYLTGKHLTRGQIARLTRQALDRGKLFAKKIAARAPRPRISLPKLRLPKRKPKQLPVVAVKECPACQAINDGDAMYCKRCAASLMPPELPPPAA